MNGFKLGLNTALTAALVLALAGSPAAAEIGVEQRSGIGLSLGEPAGITFKHWFDTRHALDLALGVGYYPYTGGALYADYQVHLVDFAAASTTDVWLYLGGGVKVGYWAHDLHGDKVGASLAARMPVGIDILIGDTPFDVFVEVAPAVAFISPVVVWFDFDAAIGARFYF